MVTEWIKPLSQYTTLPEWESVFCPYKTRYVVNHLQITGFVFQSVRKKTKNVDCNCLLSKAQPVSLDIVRRTLGNKSSFSPIVTLEPRRRKFHKPITVTIPVPKGNSDAVLHSLGRDTPTLRLLCSITGKTGLTGPPQAYGHHVLLTQTGPFFRWNNTSSVGGHNRNHPFNICQWPCVLHNKRFCEVADLS